MNKGLVSVLVVAYNAEKYIKKTLQSCLNQTYPQFEILILDNDSSDNTVEIVKSMKSEKINLFLEKENVGSFKGLNFLLDKANGEFIAIQDHDDLWFPKKIEKQIDFLCQNRNFVGCGTDTFYLYEKIDEVILNKRKFLVDCADHTSLVFRNLGFRYDPNHVLPDEHFQKKVLAEKGKLFCIKKPLTVHRIREDGKNYSLSRFDFSFKNIKELIDLNGFNLDNLLYLLVVFTEKFFSFVTIYRLAFKVFKKRLIHFSAEEFKHKYSELEI